MHGAAPLLNPRSVRAGLIASAALAAFYTAVVAGASGSLDHLIGQVVMDWYLLVPIIAGFGLQVAFLAELRRRRRRRAEATAATSAGAGASTAGMVHHESHEPCPVCDRAPTVLVAIRHPVMRRWTGELLAAEHGCWTVVQPSAGEMLVDAIDRAHPDLVIVDSVDFPACCEAALRALPSERVIVIGPEPDRAYRSRALALGAGGWVCRDHVGEELSEAMRAALGCWHHPCGPGTPSWRPRPEACVTSGAEP